MNLLAGDSANHARCVIKAPATKQEGTLNPPCVWNATQCHFSGRVRSTDSPQSATPMADNSFSTCRGYFHRLPVLTSEPGIREQGEIEPPVFKGPHVLSERQRCAHDSITQVQHTPTKQTSYSWGVQREACQPGSWGQGRIQIRHPGSCGLCPAVPAWAHTCIQQVAAVNTWEFNRQGSSWPQ